MSITNRSLLLLEILDVSQNPFLYLDIGEILLNLPVLKQFHLVSCHLNDTSFYTLAKLAETSTEENNETLPRRGHHYLEILDLSYNNITTICSNVLDGLHNLIELRLQHNAIHLIDNNFLRSFQHIKVLNLAHNAIEHVPKLSSRSLEVLNFSFNHIHHLGDYFAANLQAIRLIDFDSNYHLNHTSQRAFCFLNILSLEQITFRSSDLLTLNSFGELFCRLMNGTTKMHLIDINHNVNLKCNCLLVQVQKYLSDYQDLTCTQQGQDRYYISKLTKWFSNCTPDFCVKRLQQAKTNACSWPDAERIVVDGTCPTKLMAIDERKRKKFKLISTTAATTIATTVGSSRLENGTEMGNWTWMENATISAVEKHSKSHSISLRPNVCLLLIIVWNFVCYARRI